MKRQKPHPRFSVGEAVVGEAVVVVSGPDWLVGRDGSIYDITTNTLRLDYLTVRFEGFGNVYLGGFTPYQLRPVDPVRALASLNR